MCLYLSVSLRSRDSGTQFCYLESVPTRSGLGLGLALRLGLGIHITIRVDVRVRVSKFFKVRLVAGL